MTSIDVRVLTPGAEQPRPDSGIDSLKTAKARLANFASRMDSITLRINIITDHPEGVSEANLSAIYYEFEILCKDQDGAVITIKGAGFLQNDEIRSEVQQMVDRRLEVMKKLKNLLSLIKDKSRLKKAAASLAGVIKNTYEIIKEAGLSGKGKLDEFARDFMAAYQGVLTGKGPGQEKEKETSSEGDPYSQGELTYDLLQLFQKYNSGQEIRALIIEWEKERQEMVEESAERNQKIRLEERRFEEKIEDEKYAQKKINNRRDYTIIAARSAQDKKNVEIGETDRTAAEVRYELIKIELRDLAKQAQA